VQKTVAAYGAFVDIGSTTDGLCHISQLSHGYVKNVNDLLSAGQKVNVVLLRVENGDKLSLSMKAASPGMCRQPTPFPRLQFLPC
jgi:predicted RNA-binding protein with RPS1 domain